MNIAFNPQTADKSFGGFVKAAVQGGISAAVGNMVGGFINAGGIATEIGRAVAHTSTQSMVGLAFGQEPTLGGMASAAFGSLAGSALHGESPGVMIGGSAVAGGLGSVMGGGNLYQGAIMGGLISSVNHAMHPTGGEGGGGDEKKKIEVKPKENESTAVKLSKAALALMAADGAVPDFTDAFWQKWAAYGAVGTVAGTILYLNGDPSTWHTTYEHPSQNPIHNPPSGWNPDNPPPGLGGSVRWVIGGRLMYELYNEYNSSEIYTTPPIAPRDNSTTNPQFVPYRPK